MLRTRTIIGWVIFVVSIIAMIIPLPGKDKSHLLSEAEANDATLVIITTESADFIQPIVDKFVAETGAIVEVNSVTVEEFTTANLKQSHADIILAYDISEMVPLIKDEALDTLPLDIMWNVEEDFRDPSQYWVGFSGRETKGSLAMSGLALTDFSNSKPLAERFILYLYSRSSQEHLVTTTGEYSFLSFGVPTPSGMPELAELQIPAFNAIYDSKAITNSSPDIIASNN